MQNWTHTVRHFELERVKEHLGPNKGSILDFGAGDGFVASEIAKSSYDVLAIDPSPRKGDPFYPVLKFSDFEQLKGKSFDSIVLFHVFEHLENAFQIFNNLKIYTKNDGKILIVVPTVFCAIATFCVQPARYCMTALQLLVNRNSEIQHYRQKSKLTLKRIVQIVVKRLNPLRLVFPFGHGAASEMLYALILWRDAAYRKTLSTCRLQVLESKGLGLLYTPSKVQPGRWLWLRKKLGKFFPASRLYVCEFKSESQV